MRQGEDKCTRNRWSAEENGQDNRVVCTSLSTATLHAAERKGDLA